MQSRNWIHNIVNVVHPLLTIIFILITSPLYLVFKLLSYIKRSIFKENVAGKVVVITGASSGIGEHLAYEYARRGARLALAARREDHLRIVGERAKKLGSPDVLVVYADVAKVEDCERLIEKTMNHFGQLDHLVNNAGTDSPSLLFEDCNQVSDFARIMDVNFWGSAYCSRFAIPHLKKSKGKIVGITSVGTWSPMPRFAVYNASKAALISFYETLRIECGSDIGITIVLPGLIKTDMSAPHLANKYHGKSDPPPTQLPKDCAKAIVKGSCRGDNCLTLPFWWNANFMVKLVYPEAFEWVNRLNFINVPEEKQQLIIRNNNS